MQEEENNLEALFQKIFAGEANRNEKELVAKWLSKLDISERKLSFDEIEDQRLQLQKKFHDRMIITASGKRTIRLTTWWPAVAAAMLIVVTSIFLISPSPGKPISYQESVTKAGEWKNFTLSDGTKITLNNATRLKFPETFSGITREVYLEGEAFFDVSPNKEKPFIVKTGNLSIQVLGTSFDISNYTSDEEIDVTVTTGKVGVSTGDKNTNWQLTPGQQLSYNRKSHDVRRSEVDAKDYTSWQNGELVFENESLAVISKRLERWYDVKITIGTSVLMDKRISMEQQNESLESVMKMLGIAGDFNYEINGKNVRIW